MCFHRRSSWRDERAEEGRTHEVWDLFHREQRESERPQPVAERDDEVRETEVEAPEVPVGGRR